MNKSLVHIICTRPQLWVLGTCTQVLFTVNLIECVCTIFQGFLCVPGYYPVQEICSEVTFRFWDSFLVSGEEGREGGRGRGRDRGRGEGGGGRRFMEEFLRRRGRGRVNPRGKWFWSEREKG